MDWDTIDGLASEAIKAITQGNIGNALAMLGEIKGHANAMISIPTVWELIRADYEAGIKPKELAKKYQSHGIYAGQINNKAYSERWINKTKLKKAYKAAKNKSGNVFYPDCRECEKPFEATSGASIICPTCKALKAEIDVRRRLV